MSDIENFRSIKDIQEKVKIEYPNNLQTKDSEFYINSNNNTINEKNEMRPFFLLTLENGNGQQKQIKILEDSNPSKLAFNFCLENSLDFDTMEYLKNCIKKILNKFKNQNLDEIRENKENINVSFSSDINELEEESDKSYHINRTNKKNNSKNFTTSSFRKSPITYDNDETLVNKTNSNDENELINTELKKYKYDILDYDVNNLIDNDEDSLTEKGVPILNNQIEKDNHEILAYENLNQFDNVPKFISSTQSHFKISKKNSYNKDNKNNLHSSKKIKNNVIMKNQNQNRSLNITNYTSSAISRNNEVVNRNVLKTANNNNNNTKCKNTTANDCFYNTVKNNNKNIYWKKNGFEEKNTNTQFLQYNTNKIDKKPKTAFKLSLNVFKYNKKSMNNSNNIFIKTDNIKKTNHNNCNSLNISYNMTKNFFKKTKKKENDEIEEHSGIVIRPKFSGLASQTSLPHNYHKKKVNCIRDYTNRTDVKVKSSKNSSRSIMIRKNIFNLGKNKLNGIKNGNSQLIKDDYLNGKKEIFYSDKNNYYLYKNNETDINHNDSSSINNNKITESQLLEDNSDNKLYYSLSKMKTSNDNLYFKNEKDKKIIIFHPKNNFSINNNTMRINNNSLYKKINETFCKNQILKKKHIQFKNSSNANTQKKFLIDNGSTNFDNNQTQSKTDIFKNSQSKIIYEPDKKFKKKLALNNNNNINKKIETNNQKIEKNCENIKIADNNKYNKAQELYINTKKNYLLIHKNNQKKFKKSTNCLSSVCQTKHKNIFDSGQININGGGEISSIAKKKEDIKNININENRKNTFNNTIRINNNLLLRNKKQNNGGMIKILKQKENSNLINLNKHPIYHNLLHNKRISNSSFTVNNFHNSNNNINDLNLQRSKNYKHLKINTKGEPKINKAKNYTTMKDDDSVQLISENNKINILNKIFSLFDKDKDGIICFNDNEIYQQLQIFPNDIKSILLNLIDLLMKDGENNKMYLFPLNRTEFIELMMFYLNSLKNEEQKLLFSSESKLNELIKIDLFEYYKPKSTYNKFKKNIKI